MKLSFICPTDYIKEFGSQGDFTLALAHLIPGLAASQLSSGYEKAIKDINLPVFLDNGLFEKHIPEPLESLIEKAIKMNAELFFAPDVLFDRERTMIELKHAIEVNNFKKTGIKIGAVVQADNVKDYTEQLLQFNQMEGVDLIGLSILSIPKSWNLPIVEARIKLMEKMIELQKQGIKWKNMHLLGIGDSYKDVLFAKNNCPWIISNDSSCAFQTGYKGIKLTDNLEVPGGKIQEKVIFNLVHLTDEQKECIQYNINKIKEVIYAN